MSNKPAPNTCTPVQAYAATDGSLHRTPELAAQRGMFAAVCDEMTKWALNAGMGVHSDRWALFVRELCHPNNTFNFQITLKETHNAPPQEN